MTQKISIPREKKEKLEKAQKEFEKIWERVKPFIKKRKIKEYSTAGRWKTFDYGM